VKPINLALTRDDGRLLTRIWNAMVVTQPGEIVPSGPPLLELDSPAASDLGWASGRIAKPDDSSSGMPDASSPLIPCNKKKASAIYSSHNSAAQLHVRAKEKR